MGPARLRGRPDLGHPRLRGAAPRRACTGTGSARVSLGGIALTPGGSTTVQLTKDIAFDIQVVNQGDSTETDVGVTVTVGSVATRSTEETIPEIAAGEQKMASIPLTSQPPTGQNVPITVNVKAVPGEQVTDNNKGRVHGHLHPLSALVPCRQWTT